jgi:hypothetical protein
MELALHPHLARLVVATCGVQGRIWVIGRRAPDDMRLVGDVVDCVWKGQRLKMRKIRMFACPIQRCFFTVCI